MEPSKEKTPPGGHRPPGDTALNCPTQSEHPLREHGRSAYQTPEPPAPCRTPHSSGKPLHLTSDYPRAQSAPPALVATFLVPRPPERIPKERPAGLSFGRFKGVPGGNTKSPRESFLGSARGYSFDSKRISSRKPPTFVGGSPPPQGAVYLAFDGRIKAPRCRQASLALPGQQTET